jgi:hypothetical protein
VPTSAAATIADGRDADGSRGAAAVSDVVAASAGAAPVAAAPATAAPVKNLRRLTSACRSDLDLRAIQSSLRAPDPTCGRRVHARLRSAAAPTLSTQATGATPARRGIGNRTLPNLPQQTRHV